MSTAPSPSSPSRVRASLVLLFVVAPFFATAPFPGLLNPDEGRYAEVAREMLVTGDYLVPRLHGTPRWSKPPGTYWCAALSMKAFGFTPFAARLPSAIFGAIAVFSLYKLVAEAFDRRTGLYAAVVFASASEAFLLFRTADPNAAVAASVVVAVYAARPSAAETRRRSTRARVLSSLGVGAALGVGFMFKGPIPALLVGAAFGAASLVSRFGRSEREAAPIAPRPSVGAVVAAVASGLAVFSALALPWYVEVASRREGLLAHWIGGEVVDRYFGDDHGRTKPWWFFPAILPFAAAPWTFAWCLGAKDAFFGRDPRAKFHLAFAASTILVFSIGTSKLWTYLLPALAPLSVLAALALRRVEERGLVKGTRRLMIATCAFAGIVPLVGAALLDHRLDAPTFYWAAASTFSVAYAIEAYFRALRRMKRGDVGGGVDAFVFGSATATWFALTASLLVAATSFSNLGDKADARWVAKALERDGADVRGVPIFQGLAARERPEPRFQGPHRLVTYRMYLPSLPFDVAPHRAEVFPGYEAGTLFEMRVDREADRRLTADDLRATAATPGRTYVLTRERDLKELDAAVGKPGVVVGRASHGKHALVVARFDS